MSQYDLKIVGEIRDNEYANLKSYINILCKDDKLNVIIEDREENCVNEFCKILEQNDLIKVSDAILVDDTYKMTYKRKK
jgi:hypothetical protein